MRSRSTDRPARTPGLALALALVLAAGAAADAQRVVVGVLPSADAEVTADIVRGMRLALAGSPAGRRVDLVVGAPGERWSTVASDAVRIVTRRNAVALVTPPDRDRAHLLAQVGTRSRVPIVSTSPADSVTGAGSTWVSSVTPPGDAARTPRTGAPPAPAFDPAAPAARAFRAAFRRRHGRDPGAWEAVGYDAAELLVCSLPTSRTTRSDLVRAMRGVRVAGATGPFRIDRAGRRVAVSAGPAGR